VIKAEIDRSRRIRLCRAQDKLFRAGREAERVKRLVKEMSNVK
jgi:hypothetical protein